MITACHLKFSFKLPLWSKYRVQNLVLTEYSRDLKSDHSKSENIQNLYFLNIGFQKVWFLKGKASANIFYEIIQNLDIFVPISNGLWQYGSHLYRFQIGRFQITFKIWTICKTTSFRPIKIWTHLDFRFALVFFNVWNSPPYFHL